MSALFMLLSGMLLVSPLYADEVANTLTTLQTAHYQYIKVALDVIKNSTDTLFFVEENLETSSKTYLDALFTDSSEKLAILQQSCTSILACLVCFNGTSSMENVTQEAAADLQDRLEAQKLQYLSVVEETETIIKEGAFLSGIVYEKYKNTENFAEEAAGYYTRMRKGLEARVELFEKAVDTAEAKLVDVSVEVCVGVAAQVLGQYEKVAQCVNEALNQL